MRTITWAAIVVGIVVAGTGRGAELVKEPFKDNQSVAQRWFTGGPTADAAVSNGALVLVNIPNGPTRGALTYLTDPERLLQLQPGDELVLTFNYSYGQPDPGDWGLMFGFFDSAGKRITRRDGSFNDAIFASHRGYVGAGVFGETKSERLKLARRTGTNNNLLGSPAYETLGNPTIQTGGRRPNHLYSASLRLVCHEPGHVTVTMTIDHQTVTSKDAPALTDFDTIGIFPTRHPFQLTIRDVVVNYESAGGIKKVTRSGVSRPESAGKSRD